jgi:hypothetical protein
METAEFGIPKETNLLGKSLKIEDKIRLLCKE